MIVRNAKPWYLSKVLWVNALTMLLTLVGTLQDVLPKDWLPYIPAVLAGVNMVLRFLTTQPVSASADKIGPRL